MPLRVQPARRGHKENGCLCQVQHRGTGLTHLYKSFVILVPGGGVEPPRPCGRRILSPLRLPVPPSRRTSILSAYLLFSLTASCNNSTPGSYSIQSPHFDLARHPGKQDYC